jgi:hypothetical protein
MIKGLLFGVTILAVLWLALWAMRAEAGRGRGWAPFDMREPPDQHANPPPLSRLRRAPSGRRQRTR